MKEKDHADKTVLILLSATLAVVLVVALSITVFTSEGDGGNSSGSSATSQSGSGTTAITDPVVNGSGGTGTGTSPNITLEEYERAHANGPGPGAENPPLPSGDTATHTGTALMTAMVGGQTFKIEVAVTIKLDSMGGFAFAYAGTGTVPVSLGGNVNATADYQVGGDFTGTVSGEAFTGSGPANVQATVNMPGMAPQSGSSTQQLNITGTMHDAGNGVIEGDFSGGAYTGTFRAVKS